MIRIFKDVNAWYQQRYLIQLDEQELRYLKCVLERYCAGKGAMDVERGVVTTTGGFPARLLRQLKAIQKDKK